MVSVTSAPSTGADSSWTEPAMSRPATSSWATTDPGYRQERVVGALDTVDIHEAQDLGGKGGPTGGATMV